MDLKNRQFSLWYFALTFPALDFLEDMFAARRHTETLARNEFDALPRAGMAFR